MLIVKDSQSGFAGVTGTIWTIRPDCSYEVARFRGDEISLPHLKGQLTVQQQSQLATTLTASAIETLPARIGEPSPVNSRQLSINYGGKISVLDLGMGDPTVPGPPNDPAHRVIEIGKIVKTVTGDE